MADWTQKLAARMTGTSGGKADEPPSADPVAPAWVRVAGDRATGREPSQDDVDEAQGRSRPPRTEFEQRFLARLGFDDEPPAA